MTPKTKKPKLKTWHVSGSVVGSTYVGEYQAATKEEAEEMAWADADVSLCHQCAGKISDPEVESLHAEEADE